MKLTNNDIGGFQLNLTTWAKLTNDGVWVSTDPEMTAHLNTIHVPTRGYCRFGVDQIMDAAEQFGAEPKFTPAGTK